MDIVRKQTKSPLKKFTWPAIIALSVVVLIVLASQVSNAGISRDKSSVLLATVERGEFQVNVRAPGILAPNDIRWISSIVSGKAERVLVKPGAVVLKGDLLVELSNPQLLQQLEENKWEYEAQQAEFNALKVSLDTQLLNQQAVVLNAKLNYQSADMKLKAETTLINQGNATVSKLDYEKSKLETAQYLQRWKIEQQRLEKMGENNRAQINAREARVKKMQKVVQRIQDQVNNLKVVASMDSVVQEMPLEVGQQVAVGQSITKLARQDDLIAELQVPEVQIRDVALGQNVSIDTRNSMIEGKVIRIAPSVIQGSVQVDVELTSKLPSDARPDLSIDGEIRVAELENTLYVRRPAFAQSNSRKKIFKFDAETGIAEKTTVEFGRGSVQLIQIVDGLKVGDQIIVSDQTDIDAFDSVSLR